MTLSTKVKMPSLGCTMLTCWQEELNVVEGSVGNCFCPMWKLAFRVMVAKVSWIASWVSVRSLPWTQLKRWIPIELMGCVHTHQGMPTTKERGSPSCIQNVVRKIGEDNQKVGKTGQVISQTPTLRIKHDKIWAWWASNVSLESMLEKVWWCKCSEMEFWSWTICYPMSCSNGGTHAWVGGGRRSHAALRCCRKRNVLLSIHVKASRKKGHWSTINLIAMIKVIRAQLPK